MFLVALAALCVGLAIGIVYGSGAALFSFLDTLPKHEAERIIEIFNRYKNKR